MIKNLQSEFKKLKPFFKACPFFTFLFVCFYGLFFLFYDFIHSGSEVDLNSIVWWQKGNFFKEGNEHLILFLAQIVYIFLAIFISLWIRNLQKNTFFLKKEVLFICLLPILYTVVMTRSNTFSFSLYKGFGVGLGVAFFIYIAWLLRKRFRILFFISFAFLAFLILMGMGTPNYFDYDFFIGPALKIYQGAPLGSFYMQYGLGMTYLFKIMMDLNLRIYNIQIILALLTIFWFFLYLRLVKEFLTDKILIWLFMAVLFSFRYLAIYFDPIHTPATLPMRLDMWVPLVLVLARFGFFSWVSGVAFSFGYLFDNTFGFFHIIVYITFLCFFLVKGIFEKGFRKVFIERGFLKNFIIIVALIISVAFFQIYNFGGLFNPAAKLYTNVKLGFMPVFPHSLFWVVLALLPYSLYAFSLEKEKKRRHISFFILGLFCLQMTYFFGRSHDTNLLNISGLYILMLFITFDQLVRTFRVRFVPYGIGVVLIITSSIVFSDYYIKRFSRVLKHVVNFQIVEIHSFDKSVEENNHIFSLYPDSSKVLILSQFDSFINYRMKLFQIGYVTPFPIHIYIKDIVEFINKEMDLGYIPVFWEDEIVPMIRQMNEYVTIHDSNFMFAYSQKRGFYELIRIPRSEKQK